jgi:uncharacterized RDD family membrane protein YckC
MQIAPEADRPGIERVGFHTRVAALLVDVFILAIIAHAGAGLDMLANDASTLNYFGFITCTAVCCAAVTAIVLEGIVGATPGKWALGLIVAADDGRPASRRARWRRALFKHSATIFLSFPVVMLAVADENAPFTLREYVRRGVAIFGWVDVALEVCVAIYIVAGCFRVLRADRLAFHDVVAGTAVYRRAEVSGSGGFSPLAVEALGDVVEATESASAAATTATATATATTATAGAGSVAGSDAT